MQNTLRKTKSVILYGSSVTIGLILAKTWFIAWYAAAA
jgi:hypothetical protein